MMTIRYNFEAGKYETIENMVADFRLMFDNCQKYYEEGTRIYEDANFLNLALNEMMNGGLNFWFFHNELPDVHQNIQEILLILFKTFCNPFSKKLDKLERRGKNTEHAKLDEIKDRLNHGV